MTVEQIDLVARARAYAISAHSRIGHRRKYTQLPYDVHLAGVAKLVASVTNDPEMIAAAWLHDVVEDTPATLRDIELEFGESVAELVDSLTDVSRPSDGNRSKRKEIDREHLALASPRAKTVKLADLIDNCKDICKHDPSFAKVYLQEGEASLAVLNQGDSNLYALAEKTFRECREKLGLATQPIVPTNAPSGLLARRVTPGLTRLFMKAFTARDVAEPLSSFDTKTSSAEARSYLEMISRDVVLLTENDRVLGYAIADELKDGVSGDSLRQIHERQHLRKEHSLTDVIHVLTLHEHGFVDVSGDLPGYVRRSSVNHPVFRMWFFGVITLLEMELLVLIEEHFPNESWRDKLSPSRLAKAINFQRERRRNGQPSRLIECLQLSDKAQILLEVPAVLETLELGSKRSAKRIISELVSLRNNLAHAQDLATHDWPQIARIAARLERVFHQEL